LLDGDLVVMSPQGTAHNALIDELRERLRVAFGDGYHITDQKPLEVDAHTCPDPDLAGEVVMVVEVTVTSQHKDRRKAGYYAQIGVETFWLLDVAQRCLEVRTHPTGEGPLEGYGRLELLGEASEVAVPGTDARFSVASMLP